MGNRTCVKVLKSNIKTYDLYQVGNKTIEIQAFSVSFSFFVILSMQHLSIKTLKIIVIVFQADLHKLHIHQFIYVSNVSSGVECGNCLNGIQQTYLTSHGKSVLLYPMKTA